jgi:hypothetical protein
MHLAISAKASLVIGFQKYSFFVSIERLCEEENPYTRTDWEGHLRTEA